MDEHEVDVIEAQRLQRAVDPLPGIGVALAFGDELGGDEYLVARHAARAQAIADAALVLVGLRGIDVAIADTDRVAHGAGGGVIGDHPGAEAELRDGDAVRQGRGLVQDHDDAFPWLAARGP
ncbi:hypothetical protein JQK15_19010 [Sphingobium sp. BHU LFT2]|nr:hypothetical protein [Sphingobium sp. BHU LFT2]MBT2245615.1 hypothetical protein [Sphingobium sp. BHU LFT2]